MRRTRRTRPLVMAPLLLGMLALGLALPSGALANRGNDIIKQCAATETVSGSYSQQDYQYALAHLPTDVAEYSSCADVIRRAELAAASRASGAGTGGAAGSGAGPVITTQGSGLRDPYATASKPERAAIVAAQRARPANLRLGNSFVRPGFIAVHPASFVHSMPASLLAALLALAALALGAVGWATFTRVRTRRSR